MDNILLCTASSSDFNFAPSSLTFMSGEGNGVNECLTVSITDDNMVECDEQFTVSLTLNTEGDSLSTGNTLTTVTIMDDDGS